MKLQFGKHLPAAPVFLLIMALVVGIGLFVSGSSLAEAQEGEGSITVVKAAVPEDPQDFDFTIDGPGFDGGTIFTLDDDGDPLLSDSETFSNLGDATYSVTELASPASWELSDISCTGQIDSSVSVVNGGAGVDITLVSAEDITCTFTNINPATISIDPLIATNAVNDPHTLTGHVTVNDGSGPANAPDGTAINFNIVSGPGSFPGPTGCNTAGGTGSCSVVPDLTSAVPGITEVSASTLVTVGAFGSLARSTDGSNGNSGNANKTWVDARISIGPDDINEVGDPHTFTVLVEKNDGTAWVPAVEEVVTITFPVGDPDDVDASTCVETDANGQCTVEINNAAAGIFTAHAEVTVTVAGFDLTRDAEATKTYLDANIQISPLDATKPLGELQLLTGQVNVNLGQGMINAPAGTVIGFQILSGPGSLSAASCTTTNALGTCAVTVESVVEGQTVVEASTTVTVPQDGGASLSRQTDGIAPNSAPSVITWGVVDLGCGLDIVNLFDESTSISTGEFTAEQAAVVNFLNRLAGTNTEVALVDYGTLAHPRVDFTTNFQSIINEINNVPQLAPDTQYTNWEQALLEARNFFGPASPFHRSDGHRDLIIMIGDPTPTAFGTSGGPFGTTPAEVEAARAAAQVVSDALRNNGITIIAFAVGGGDLSLLETIADEVIDVGAFGTAGFDPTGKLNEFAERLCGGTITVHKTIDDDGQLGTTDDQSRGVDWEFTPIVTNGLNPGSDSTGDDGVVAFRVIDMGTATVDLAETVNSGFGLLSAECTVDGVSRGTPAIGDLSINGIVVDQTDIVVCNYYNSPLPTLILQKIVINDDGEGNLSADNFTVKIDDETNPPIFPVGDFDSESNTKTFGPVTLEPGDYIITESGPNGFENIYRITFGGDLTHNPGAGEGPFGTITLVLGQDAFGTITNDDFPSVCTNAADVMLVLDVSSSMNSPSSDLEDLKTVALDLVDSFRLQGDVRMGVVQFGSTAQLLQGLTHSSADIKTEIESLSVAGTTVLTDTVSGIDRAAVELAAHPRAHIPQIIIVVTDASTATQTQSDTQIAIASANSGAEVFGIGVGTSPNQGILDAIANPSDATHTARAGDFASLALLVDEIVDEACPEKPILTITKLLVNDAFADDQSITVSDFTLVLTPTPPSGGPVFSTEITLDHGVEYLINEIMPLRDDQTVPYEFAFSGDCNPDGPARDGNGNVMGDTITLYLNESADCTLSNYRQVYVDNDWGECIYGVDPDLADNLVDIRCRITGFDEIQGGIDAFSHDFGTVMVQGGPYDETGNPGQGLLIEVDNLNLLGEGKTTTLVTLRGASESGIGLHIAANNVTVDGFDFSNSRVCDINNQLTGGGDLNSGPVIAVDDVSGATVSNNNIHGGIAGVVLHRGPEDSSGHSVIDNMIWHNKAGIAIDSSDANLLQDNDIFDNCDLPSPQGSAGIAIGRFTSGGDPEGNHIVDNQIHNNFGDGILLSSGAGNTTINGITSITGSTTGNSILNNSGRGIFLDEAAGSGNVANLNAIAGNGDGVLNEGGTTFDAINNWWGKPSGPSGMGAGDGDSVSSNVDYRPWLLQGDADADPTNGFQEVETFAQTIALPNQGQFALLSAPQLLDAVPTVLTDDGGAAAMLGFANPGGIIVPGSPQFNSDVVKPISGMFIMAETSKAGVGLNFAAVSAPTQTSKVLGEGWNLIGTNFEGTVPDELAQIQNGMTTFHAPDVYNGKKDFGLLTWGALADRDLNAIPIIGLARPGGPPDLSVLDAYWANLDVAGRIYSKQLSIFP